MKEMPVSLNDFPVIVTRFLLTRANQLWHNAYEDCAPEYLTIPDLHVLTHDPVVLDTVYCMAHTIDPDEVIHQLEEFNTNRAHAIGVEVTTLESPLPLYATLFERPKVELEDEYPF